MFKRLFDIAFAFLFLLVLSPLMVFIALWVTMDSRGGVFFFQERVGKNSIPFHLMKFRTMRPHSEQFGQITVGAKDPRITSAGAWLRKYKMDELPQLFNILKGDMAVVGPRPEVPKYVKLYTPEQLRVLEVRPGLTDFASLEFFHENELLSKSPDPERTYVEEIMPVKLALNLKYITEASLFTDLNIILLTIRAIFRG